MSCFLLSLTPESDAVSSACVMWWMCHEPSESLLVAQEYAQLKCMARTRHRAKRVRSIFFRWTGNGEILEVLLRLHSFQGSSGSTKRCHSV